MPYKSLKPCRFPQCKKLTAGTYCPEHKKQIDKSYDAKRKTATERGYTSREWKSTRQRILERDPLCCECLKNLSNECDHIIPKNQGGTDNDDNMQGLCKSCHSTKTLKERNEHKDRGL